MAESTIRVKVDLDEEALRERIIEVIAGHAVVKPGETLVIRLKDWDADAVGYYQEYLDSRNPPFSVLAVVGDELAVAKPFDAHADEALAVADPFADLAAQRGG